MLKPKDVKTRNRNTKKENFKPIVQKKKIQNCKQKRKGKKEKRKRKRICKYPKIKPDVLGS